MRPSLALVFVGALLASGCFAASCEDVCFEEYEQCLEELGPSIECDTFYLGCVNGCE